MDIFFVPGEGQIRDFKAVPGHGVRAVVDGHRIALGNHRMIPAAGSLPLTANLEAQGKTLLFVESDHQLAGVLAAEDALRSEVPTALAEARTLGINYVELLTGDNERTASALAQKLRVSFCTNLLPENKIDIVKEFQAEGYVVVMVGDGVNDAPALVRFALQEGLIKRD